MKKTLKACALAMALTAMMTVGAVAAQKQNNVITVMADGTSVVNTKTLAPKVKGFQGATPLKIYIKSGKIKKIEALANQETPKYFARVKQLLIKKYVGQKVAKAAKMNPDGVTGATLSSNAVKENIRRGLDFYMENK